MTDVKRQTVAQRLAALSPQQRRLLELELEEHGIEVSRLAIIRRSDRGGPVAQSFAQQRLYFLEQLEPGHAANHIVTHRRVRGATGA